MAERIQPPKSPNGGLNAKPKRLYESARSSERGVKTEERIKSNWKERSSSFFQFLRNPKQALLRQAIARHRQFLEKIAPLAQEATVTQVIANVPELILAPLEFEFAPEIRKPHQHFLGLCMRPHRQDTELDPLFEQAWEHIVGQNKPPLQVERGQGAVGRCREAHILQFWYLS